MSSAAHSFVTTLQRGYLTAGVNVQEGLLLAVSGGADSVALLHGTCQLWPERSGKILVAHVNHGLRGSESDSDAEFVATLTGSLGLPFEQLTVLPGDLQQSHSGSLEEAARKIRYEFLTDAATRLGVASVATAHHLDDQAETILHNIIRGTGLRGLAGMQPFRPLNDRIQLVRPMLAMSRRDINAVVAAAGYKFRDDQTNQDVEITRNRIRQQLLPFLASEFNPQVSRTLVSLGQQAAEAARCLDELADRALEDIVLEFSQEICRLDAERAAEAPNELLRHALTRLWSRLRWPRQKMTSSHWHRLASVLRTSTAASFQLPGPIHVTRRGRMVRLSRQTRPGAADSTVSSSES